MANLSDLIAPSGVQEASPNLDDWAGKVAPTGTPVGATDNQTLTNKTLQSPNVQNPNIAGEVTEAVYNMTGTDLDPANGTIQYKVLTSNITLTESLASGQSVLLRLGGGSTYAVSWFPVVWVGGAPPTLTADDVLVFWQEGTTVYGSYLGGVV